MLSLRDPTLPTMNLLQVMTGPPRARVDSYPLLPWLGAVAQNYRCGPDRAG